jgi:hypothetical protein
MRAISRATRDKTTIDQRWAAPWAERQEVGGTTGYRDLFTDAPDRTKALERELASLNRTAGKGAAMAIVLGIDRLAAAEEALERLSLRLLTRPRSDIAAARAGKL